MVRKTINHIKYIIQGLGYANLMRNAAMINYDKRSLANYIKKKNRVPDLVSKLNEHHQMLKNVNRLY